MHFVDTQPVPARLATEVRQRMPEMVKRTVAQILEEMPVYGRAEFVPHDELARSVTLNISVVLRTLQGAGPPDMTQVSATGRLRAHQGAPLPELLRAYRIGLTQVWLEFTELTRDTTELVAVTSAIWALMDDYAEALTTSYRDTTASMMLAHQNRRSALVEALFAGGSDGSLWDIARVLDLALDGTFVVVAAETPALGQEALPQIESRLRTQCLASAWRLTPDLQVGVVSLRHPTASATLVEQIRDDIAGRVGVSPVYCGLGNTARALHLARVALSSLPPGRPALVQFNDSPLAGLVASAPEASVQLAHQVLSAILDLPGEDRNVLLLTLRAWFECQGSTKLTAQRMFCHPNTIRHRLKRVTDELGRSLTDPADIMEIGTALRALSIFPDTAHLPPPARPA
nr:helix-turn-helix domain-containing protein [Kibdelosporangium sp. MJ126-NF4]CEL21404.1 Regulator of polyketide synthase expression [Kibdelosporangium sp. MJ126-NF4]CTQ96029.1 Regulator of polyketide synthase expression [Kibdelosporangium sp. MJ126-NF4]